MTARAGELAEGDCAHADCGRVPCSPRKACAAAPADPAGTCAAVSLAAGGRTAVASLAKKTTDLGSGRLFGKALYSSCGVPRGRGARRGARRGVMRSGATRGESQWSAGTWAPLTNLDLAVRDGAHEEAAEAPRAEGGAVLDGCARVEPLGYEHAAAD